MTDLISIYIIIALFAMFICYVKYSITLLNKVCEKENVTDEEAFNYSAEYSYWILISIAKGIIWPITLIIWLYKELYKEIK